MTKWLYRDNDNVYTEIHANKETHTVEIKNHTEDPLLRAFGVNEDPTWDDYIEFLQDITFRPDRADSDVLLNAMGIKEYNPEEIAKHTHGKHAGSRLYLQEA